MPSTLGATLGGAENAHPPRTTRDRGHYSLETHPLIAKPTLDAEGGAGNSAIEWNPRWGRFGDETVQSATGAALLDAHHQGSSSASTGPTG